MDVTDGYHFTPKGDSILIQIQDNDCLEFPIPVFPFTETYQFNFLDIEEDIVPIDPAMKISDEQAAEIVAILEKALAYDMDVVVHCHAGVCRSGAVCEVGVMLGFDETSRYRQPNLLVKKKLLQQLNMWGYE